jgi:hypothetical protein
MQLQTTRPDWFQTVPLTWAIDPEFDITEYFGDFEIDTDANEDVIAILKIAAFIKIAVEHSATCPTPKELNHYKELVTDLSRYPIETTGGDDLSDKIDCIGSDGCGEYWELLGTYKGFQIFAGLLWNAGSILVSQPNGPCFETRDGRDRFSSIASCDHVDVAIADAQEFIDCFVLSQRNDDPEHDWNVLGRIQLSLPLQLG